MKRESGNWNRSGRRGGGERPFRVGIDETRGPLPLLGPCCAMGRHALCAGNCVCDCHTPASPTPDIPTPHMNEHQGKETRE